VTGASGVSCACHSLSRVFLNYFKVSSRVSPCLRPAFACPYGHSRLFHPLFHEPLCTLHPPTTPLVVHSPQFPKSFPYRARNIVPVLGSWSLRRRPGRDVATPSFKRSGLPTFNMQTFTRSLPPNFQFRVSNFDSRLINGSTPDKYHAVSTHAHLTHGAPPTQQNCSRESR